MPKFLTPIDLVQNELLNARLHNLPAAPSSPVEGQVYQNTTDHKTYVYDGTSWIDLSSAGTVTGVTATAPIVSSGGTAPVISITQSGIDHGSIAGLGDDDHTQYVHNTTARTITAQHTFAPSTVKAPFLLGTNAQGQLVTGLNADKLDGLESGDFVKKDGTVTMTGSLNMGSNTITNLADPTSGTMAATKTYVDTVVSNARAGLSLKEPVAVATTAALPANVKAHVGTLTASALGAIPAIDGYTPSTGDRILVKNEADASANGWYVLTNPGASGAYWVLTRADDANNDPGSEVYEGCYSWVNNGTTNANTRWVLTTNGAITLGTTALSFTKDFQMVDFDAGAGLTKSGNTVNVVGTANRITANADSVDIAGTYVGQTSITTLGTIGTGTWNATTISAAKGGTGQTAYTLGDTLYSSAANTLAKLAGNTTTTKKFLAQTGTGSASAAPAWDTLVNGDVPSALTGKTYNGLTLTANPVGFSVAGGTTSKTLNVGNTLTLSGTDGSTLNIGAGGTLASMAYQASSSVSITGGSITGITDLAVADGGTGASTAVAARSNLGATGKYAADIGNGSLTSIDVTHSLNSLDVVVQVKDKLSPANMVLCDVQYKDVNTVTCIFATAPTANQYRVVVVG